MIFLLIQPWSPVTRSEQLKKYRVLDILNQLRCADPEENYCCKVGDSEWKVLNLVAAGAEMTTGLPFSWHLSATAATVLHAQRRSRPRLWSHTIY